MLAQAVDIMIIMEVHLVEVAMAQEKNENPAPNGTHYQIIKNLEELENFVDWLPELEENECYYVELFCRRKYALDMPHSKSYNLVRHIAPRDGIINALRRMEVPVGSYTLRGTMVTQESLAVYISTNPRCLTKAAFSLVHTLLEKIQTKAELRPHSAALTAIHRSKARSNFVTFDIDTDPACNYNRAFMEVRELIGGEAVNIIKTRGGYHLLVKLDKVISVIKNWHPKIQSLVMPDQTGDILSPVPGCVQGDHIPYMVVQDGEDR